MVTLTQKQRETQKCGHYWPIFTSFSGTGSTGCAFSHHTCHHPSCIASRPPDGANATRGMAPVLRGIVGFSSCQPSLLVFRPGSSSSSSSSQREKVCTPAPVHHADGVGGQVSAAGGEKSARKRGTEKESRTRADLIHNQSRKTPNFLLFGHFESTEKQTDYSICCLNVCVCVCWVGVKPGCGCEQGWGILSLRWTLAETNEWRLLSPNHTLN